MTSYRQILACSTILAFCVASGQASVDPGQAPLFPPQYSSGFVQPLPPSIQGEFSANYMQQKYNDEVNNIVSGFAYFSPSLGKIRADGAFSGVLEASIFDFNNVSADGSVANSILSFFGSVTQSTCSFFYVVPGFQLFEDDVLNTMNAVYLGIQHDDIYGAVSAWQLLFLDGTVPVTAFLDANNTFVRYDFSAPGPLRTFTTTRFFNIIPGPVNATVFETLCS